MHKLVWLLVGWGALVAAFFWWQAYNYVGFFAWIAERQFALFDELYPVATIVLIALILCLPLIVLILFRMAKRRRKYGPATPQQSLDSNRRIQKWLGGVGIAALLVAGGLVLYALSVGSFTCLNRSACFLPTGPSTFRAQNAGRSRGCGFGAKGNPVFP